MKVVCYEGLFSYRAGFVRKGVGRAIERTFPYSNVEYRKHTDKRPLSNDTVVVIGHSFGAWRAYNQAEKVQLLVTIDFRFWWVLKAWKTLDFFYVRKKTVKQHLNFFQVKSFKGYQIRNAQNFQIDGVKHTKMPKDDWLVRKVLDAIRR